MKKFLLSIAALTSTMLVSAQEIAGYSAKISQGTYTELKDAKVVETGLSAEDVPGSVLLPGGLNGSGYNATIEGEGFEIGFSFPFNGEEFTRFGIIANGGLRLGKEGSMTISPSNYALTQSSEDYDNLILFSDSWVKSQTAEEGDTLQIQYATIGDEGNRELIIEYKNMGINTSSWKTELIGTYDMQIHLYQDGKIAYVVKGLSDLDPEQTAGSIMAGVRGKSDFITYGDIFTTPWRTFNHVETTNLAAVADGFTLMLDTPADVTTPETQPTDMKVSCTGKTESVNVTVEFTPAVGADRTLVVFYEGEPTALPEDKVIYAEGDAIGNGIVVMASDEKQVTARGMKHSTEYNVVAYAYNSYGTNGPKYNTVQPLQKKVTTSPAAPAKIALKAKSANSLTIETTANENNDLVFIAYSDESWNPGNYGARAFTGEPDASLKAGDPLFMEVTDGYWDDELGEYVETTETVEAGKVAYFGPAAEFVLDNLEQSTSYYFNVYSYNPESEQFSCGDDTLQLAASTYIIPTYELDLSKCPEMGLPGGWTTTHDWQGFSCQAAGRGNVMSQTDGGRVISVTRAKDETVEMKSAEIILPESSELQFDFHMHARGSGWFASNALYDEWEDEDQLQFLLYVEGQEEPVVLQKYDAASPAEFETVDSWNTYTVDLSAYAGKTVRLGWSWLCASTSLVYFALENLKITDNSAPTAISTVENNPQKAALYNIGGQRVDATNMGIIISNGKKYVVK